MLFLHLLLPFIPFTIISYVNFYIPGALLLDWAQPKIGKNDFFLISWAVGVSLFMLGIYIFSWLHFWYGYVLVVMILLLFAIFKKRKIFFIPLGKMQWLLCGIILFGSLSFLGLTFWSGSMVGKDLQFVGITNSTDGLMHIAFIKNMMRVFPPQHVGLMGYALRGYHYFYDLLLSRFSLFYGFSPEDLQYRLFPLFMSLLYGAGFYEFSKLLTKNIWSLASVLFFAYFSQSWAEVVHLFVEKIDPANGFGVVQPLELILDPSVIFSIGIFLLILHLFINLNKSIKVAVIIGIVLGVLCELKIYMGVIAGVSIFLLSLYEIFIKGKSKLPYGILLGLSGLITAITFLPNNLGAGTSLFYSPLFVYESFMQESFFSSWHWEIRRVIYSMHNNYIRLMQLYGEAFLLYWFLSLGTKSFFVLGIRNTFKKDFWLSNTNVLTILFLLIPILIGSLFVQSISIFDTKQFFWIAAALMAIPAGMVMGSILAKSSLSIKIIIIALIIFSSLDSYYYNENKYFMQPSALLLLPQKQLEIFSAIHSEVHANEFSVVLPLYNDRPNLPKRDNFIWYPAPLVAAMSGRNTYLEPEVAQFDLNSVMVARRNTLYALYTALNSCDAFGAKHILDAIGTKFLITFIKYPCIVRTGLVSKIYSSPEMNFYVFK